MPTEVDEREERYFLKIARALRVCASYKPMFGRGRKGAITLEEFQGLYRADPFYNWMGLDSPLMYAAHKAAGGMTSIYRQLGIGCQWLFSSMLRDTLGLSAEEAAWAYRVPTPGGGFRSLSLDGRIALEHVRDATARARVSQWLSEVLEKLSLAPEVRDQIKGVVFEVRQGYKSKDSKRQNADLANAANAYANLYVPALLLLSSQIDNDIAIRYAQARWLLLTGTTSGHRTDSTYVFCREVLGYDLAGFFERNSSRIKAALEQVLSALVQA